MKADKIERMLEVAASYTDIKDLIGGYSLHVNMAKFDKQENHPFLNFKDSKWTREQLDENVEWHERIAQMIAEKLFKLGIDVHKPNFWDDTLISPIEGLTYKKLKEEQTFELVEDNFNLEKDLHASAEIRELVKDDKFAQALYAALCNVSWRKDGIEWGCSWRYAGGLVADLRNAPKAQDVEDYMNYYCSGIGDRGTVSEGHVDAKVREALAKIKWVPNEEDVQRNLGF